MRSPAPPAAAGSFLWVRVLAGCVLTGLAAFVAWTLLTVAVGVGRPDCVRVGQVGSAVIVARVPDRGCTIRP